MMSSTKKKKKKKKKQSDYRMWEMIGERKGKENCLAGLQ